MRSIKTPANGTPGESFPIVAIGASAGGLAPLERFLSALPGQFGFALVFVQHLSPTHKSLLPELLRSRNRGLNVVEVSDGLRLLPGTLYVCPPAKEVTIRSGFFGLAPRSKPHPHLSIDEFLISLSKDSPGRTVAIIFSGAGTDGARGVRAVRTAGGAVFVQDPSTAEYPDMPMAAIDTGQTDAVLAPEGIAREVLKFSQTGMVNVTVDDSVTPGRFDTLCRIVGEKTGYRFTHYKRSVVIRRVKRRMYLQGVSSLDDYLVLLEGNDEETSNLAADLLIGVTSFFRDRLAWKALHLEVTKKLAVEEGTAPIRVWTVACATGEEAYSIAMMLQEELDLAGRQREIQVFATDVNERALERARAGVYPVSISADLPPGYLQKYFTISEEGLTATVNKEIRQHVVFARHDLLTDPPFSRLDLVVCRNLLIYFEPDAQEKCIALFHYALKKKGHLFLGNAESPGRDNSLFTALAHKKCRVYRKTDSKKPRALPLAIPFIREPSTSKAQPAREQQLSVTARIQEALLETHAPAAVAINERHDVVYHNGPTNRYLRQPRGTPTQNLLELLPDNLRNRMRSALYRAAGGEKPISIRTSIAVNDRKKQVSILVSRVQENLFLIAFRERGRTVIEAEASAESCGGIEEAAVRQLENELSATREDLQSHIEQLRSLNEELESSNEELQAANEELETSKEELQSLNEELSTVNAQLQLKIEEEEETNDDLHNFLASADIPTLFLDLQFRVRRFTPAMARLTTLIPGDLGRPIMDMAQENLGPDLLADARSVLDRLNPVRAEMRINDAWYVRTILPYRTADNRIEGVVIAYNDVTDLKRVEESLRQSGRRYQELVQNANSAIIRWKADGTIIFFNEYAETFFGYSSAEVIGRNVGFLVPDTESSGADLRHLVRDVATYPERFRNNVNENVRRDGSRVWMTWTNKAILDDRGQVAEILAVGIDITDQRAAEERIRHLASFPELNVNPVIEVERSGEVSYLNPGARQIMQRAGLGEEGVGALLPADMSAILDGWDGLTESTVLREVSIGDSIIEESIGLVPQFKVARIYGRDITRQALAEDALRESEEKYRSLFRNLLDAFCYCQMIFDEEGNPTDYVYLEVNDAFAAASGYENVVGRRVTEVIPGVLEAHPEMFAAYGRVALTGRPETFEMQFTPSDRWFSVSAYSVRKGYVAIIFDNITERRVHENRIARLTRLYEVLSRVNETIVRTRDEELLFSEVCQTVAEIGGFPLVWVGLTQGQQVLPVAHCGPEAEYLKKIKVEVKGKLGAGPTGTCIRENRPVLNDDFAVNSNTLPWRSSALEHGFYSSAAFPLRRQDKAIGAFTLYAHERHAFDAEQIHLLESLSADVSYALDALEIDRLRERTERALRESEERFRRMFDHHRAVMLLIDPETGAIVDANDAAAEYYGYSREDLRSRHIEEINLLSVAEVKAARLEAAAHQEDRFVFPHRLADGRTRWVEVYSTPVDAAGKTLLFSIIHDITERKRAEGERESTVACLRMINESRNKDEMVRSAVSFFQKLSGCQAVGIRLKEGDDYPYYETRGFPEEFVLAETHLCMRDKEGRPVCDSAGYPIMECMCGNVIQGRADPSKPFFTENGSFWTNSTTVLLATSTEEDRRARTRNRCNGEGYESVALIALRTGTETMGLLQMNDATEGRFTPEDIALLERLAGYLAVALAKVEAEEGLRRARDELERRVEERTVDLREAYDKLVEHAKERNTLEAQLRQSQKMEALGTLTGGIAHDFNNILAAIMGFTEVVRDRMEQESRERHYLDRVFEAGLRGRELVRRMMVFSRKSEQERKPLLLSSIVQETMQFVRSSTPATISIKVRTGEETGTVFADPVQMQQVILNLCTNAVQAMQEHGGMLDVEVDEAVIGDSAAGPEGVKTGSYVKLVVSDTGTGMPAEVVDRVFDPFFTTKRVGEGTGLGLSVVHGIVRQHEGYVTVESTEGRGSTFTVYLPLTAGETTCETEVGQLEPVGHERILFVDDEELLAEMGQELLEDLGYEVTVCTKSTEALALFASDPNRFDLIITDVTMPEMTGVDLARKMLHLRADVPVIMCTGFSHLIDADTAKAAGIKGFVMKPLTKREIAGVIRKVLDG